jgi:hypothetical protein
MNASQLATYKSIRAEMKTARDAYHAALAAKSPAAIRIQAERLCTAATDEMNAFQATL